MTPALQDAVELLERSLAYTRGRLGDVGPTHLVRATPCAGWDLRVLLAHLDDGLDAFTEAAAGHVAVDPPRGGVDATGAGLVDTLQHKACTLLGAWLAARPPEVRVGGAGLEPALLVGAAALEITVHGWDVGRTVGPPVAVPDDLAHGLLDVAHRLVGATGRAPQFGPARPVAVGAGASDRLLAWTGRGTEPPATIPGVRPAHGGLAS